MTGEAGHQDNSYPVSLLSPQAQTLPSARQTPRWPLKDKKSLPISLTAPGL